MECKEVPVKLSDIENKKYKSFKNIRIKIGTVTLWFDLSREMLNT